MSIASHDYDSYLYFTHDECRCTYGFGWVDSPVISPFRGRCAYGSGRDGTTVGRRARRDREQATRAFGHAGQIGNDFRVCQRQSSRTRSNRTVRFYTLVSRWCQRKRLTICATCAASIDARKMTRCLSRGQTYEFHHRKRACTQVLGHALLGPARGPERQRESSRDKHSIRFSV